MKIGTRGSALALWQARTVARLIQATGGPDCEIVVIRTSGDEKSGPPDAPRTGGVAEGVALNVKRLFVKEIEDALLEGRVDMAVHSAKDLPGDLPDGLIIAATLEREDPRDAILLPGSAVQGFEVTKATLGPAPRIGTSSVRRMAELRAVFPRATFIPIRGNVDTRLRKLDAGECDALVLAAAGIKRLGLDHRVSALMPTDICLPAPGQGIVAVEIAERAGSTVRDIVTRISDADSETALLAERAVVHALGGGCQMPLGALATIDGQDIAIRGLVASLDGRIIVRAVARGNRGGAAAAGEKLAAQLIAKGARGFLK
ncbi:MAG TPA: hydroxymethylbilane synthase [Vicinamibacterales bacterium]|nr:hydroxymethylbilane synthase [Vicinamibacterales bacterium]